MSGSFGNRVRAAGLLPAFAALAAVSIVACSPEQDEDPLGADPPANPPDPSARAAPGTPLASERRPFAAADTTEPVPDARALLRPTDGHATSGVVEFVLGKEPDRHMSIVVELAGLMPGMHGLHIHENGDCSAPDASSAGDHFAPEGRPHGPPFADSAQHHVGDLGNIEADADGIAVATIISEELTLTGAHGVENRAVIVHAEKDDYVTQPSGNSGDPVACGAVDLIEAADD